MSDSSSPHAAQPASAGTHHADMQAVVVIHGMGEQRPMDTIKAFVKAAWETDAVITANKLPHPAQVWSKPDVRTGSLELRRITTRESIPSASFPHGVRTDFYELYWADLTAGSTWEQFTGWVCGLLFRPLCTRPPTTNAHHHRLAQPRHHARPRSSELFLGATRGTAKDCRNLAGIRRAVRAGTRRGRSRSKSHGGGARSILRGAAPPACCPCRPAGAPCTESAGPARSALAHHGFRHARKPPR